MCMCIHIFAEYSVQTKSAKNAHTARVSKGVRPFGGSRAAPLRGSGGSATSGTNIKPQIKAQCSQLT